MESSGVVRRAMWDRGHFVISADYLSAEDVPAGVDSHRGGHWQGDVFEALDHFIDECGMLFDIGIFHPTCTYLTGSAEWAYSDPDFDRYPGVGYHQKVKEGTLVGAARRAARDAAVDDVIRLARRKGVKRKAIENPIGCLSTRWRKPDQIIHPNHFGHDASKKTGLHLDGLMMLRPTKIIPPTLRANGKSYWANQTDTGQNRLSPGDDRWRDRSRTYEGIAEAMAEQWA